MRTGLIAKKVGMTRIFTDSGSHVPVTVLHVDDCCVTAVRSLDKDGYNAVQMGCGRRKVKHTSKPMRGHFSKGNVEPRRKLVEFRVGEDALLPVGSELSAGHFIAGQYVDVTADSIGKGFAGGMKRHNYHGLRASHGVSVSHRSLGSTGNNQEPGKVWKGKKMAGHMGAKRRTVQNLEVVSVDLRRDLLFVRGSVPGSEGGWVYIKDSFKKFGKDIGDLPYPAGLRSDMQGGQSADNQDGAQEGISENEESASAESLHSETSASE